MRNLSCNLAFDNRREEALVAARESVSLCRILGWETYEEMDSLADSLLNLSDRLGGLGYRENALPAMRKPEGIYRDLARDQPDVYNPKLADALNTSVFDLQLLANMRKH